MPQSAELVYFKKADPVPFRKDWPPYECNDRYPMVRFLLRFAQWVQSGKCMILDRDDPDRPVPMVPRVGQWEVLWAMLDQASMGQPIRILVPKYRRHGISTFIQALFYFMVRTIPYRNCRTAAHRDTSATEIFQLAKIMYENDPDFPRSAMTMQEARWKIEPPGMHSTYKCESGAGAFAMSGGTIHALHVSELAKFKNTQSQDKQAMESMLNAVSQTSSNTIVVLESSGQGPEGVFPERCLAAVEDPEHSSYRCVFLPWSLDPTLQLDEDGLPDEFKPPLKGDEITLRDAHKLTDGQLAWRRSKLWDEFRSREAWWETPPSFKWDYPLVLEDCFGQKTGRIYPSFSRKVHCHPVDIEKLSDSAYWTRCIDWGASQNHAFCCLWVLVDPKHKPCLRVNPEACPQFVKEMLSYSRNPKTGKRNKMDDHGPDSLRYLVATFNLEGLVYIAQELYVTDPRAAMPTTLARTIHEMSGWRHPGGEDHPDLKLYEPIDESAFRFEWRGPDVDDSRFSWRNDEERDFFDNAFKMGAGVADKHLQTITQFCEWGIPLVPYVNPQGSSAEMAVEDGFMRINVLIAGNTLFHAEKKDTERNLVVSGWRKLGGRRAIEPTAEEFAAMRADTGIYDRKPDGGGDGDGEIVKKQGRDMDLDITGWGSL